MQQIGLQRCSRCGSGRRGAPEGPGRPLHSFCLGLIFFLTTSQGNGSPCQHCPPPRGLFHLSPPPPRPGGCLKQSTVWGCPEDTQVSHPSRPHLPLGGGRGMSHQLAFPAAPAGTLASAQGACALPPEAGGDAYQRGNGWPWASAPASAGFELRSYSLSTYGCSACKKSQDGSGALKPTKALGEPWLNSTESGAPAP